jgi:hypothetical protein
MASEPESWTLNYLPEGGGRILGTLSVSGEAVTFESGDLEDEIVLPCAEIAGAEAARRRLMNRVVVTMKDGRSFVFEYGLLSVKRIVEAIGAAG